MRERLAASLQGVAKSSGQCPKETASLGTFQQILLDARARRMVAALRGIRSQ
jgi:hypothetical protein